MAHRHVLKFGKCGVSHMLRRFSIVESSCVAHGKISKIHTESCRFSQQAETAVKNPKVQTQPSGKNTHEFQAETRMLLEIVAKSLYSDKEVFIRELISNASDAMEKLRYAALTQGKSLPDAMKINISTDKQNRIFTIQDSGVGMTKEELISNLGTIARSGSKAFLEELHKAGQSGASQSSNIIGQFGVGFYSSFMVAEKVEVYTRSHEDNSVGYKWSSDGSGTYDIEEAPDAERGTSIKIYLKVDSREFSDEDTVKNIIRKYSNFVGSPVFVNGEQVNIIQPLWLKDPKEIEPEHHAEFYKFVSNSYDRPRFTLQYRTESPISIKALLYFPEMKPDIFQLSRESDSGVALYTRKVLIQNRAENLLPKWLRFVKGVVDSEDIPLNLSRELLQNSALIAKLRSVLTAKILKFLHEKLTKSPEEYEKFHRDYSIFLKEGILVTNNSVEREDIAKLLLFEFSSAAPGVKRTLADYVSAAKGKEEKKIYYLNAPSRQLAEASPYYESIRKKDVDVIFCYERYDELIFAHLKEFSNFKLVSLENEIRNVDSDADDKDLSKLKDTSELENWFKTNLKGKVYSVKTTQRLESHPCVITVEEMASARQFIRNQSSSFTDESKYSLLQPQLELNPKHPIIKKMSKLITSDPKLAELLGKQLFSNAMVQAGLLEDPRALLIDMNELLTLALDKH